MYELIKISENDYYIASPSKIGVVKISETEVILIDSGLDKDAGKRALKLMNSNGWNIAAILNTHSHADHIGGNKYLQTQTGCHIYAPGIEAALSSNPILEPALLYGGYPHKDLRHKFLLADRSDVEPLTDKTIPKGFEIIDLPGHYFDMVGFRTPDDTVYLADALASMETFEKYAVSFLYDVSAYLETLEKIKGLRAKLFIPSHGSVTDSIAELAQYNIDKVHEVEERILTLCSAPICFEQLLQRLFYSYGIEMTVEQYALVGSTLRSYLSWLKDNGKLELIIRDNLLLWARI